jgi:hypothetical protein
MTKLLLFLILRLLILELTLVFIFLRVLRPIPKFIRVLNRTLRRIRILIPIRLLILVL